MEPDLRRFCARIFNDAEPENLKRLTGGANMETWAFQCAGQDLILRRTPAGATLNDEGVDRISLKEEAALIQTAEAAGVKAPAVVGVLTPEDKAGDGFIMTRLPGEALPQRLFKDPRYDAALTTLPRAFAEQLARIHNVTPPDFLARQSTKTALQKLYSRYVQYNALNPVFETAFRWLFDNLLAEKEQTLVHGDFRMGNLLVTEEGLSGVLDWELAHVGDPVQDIAYLCAPSWRFGRYEKTVGGVGDIDDLLEAYGRESGQSVDLDRFNFWLVFGTLWWGVTCLTMVDIWRSGVDKAVERLVVGTRVSEVEVDLLLMLEGILDIDASHTVELSSPGQVSHDGESQPAEIVSAVREWIAADIARSLEGDALFRALVAANALAIVQRRFDGRVENEAAEKSRLSDLGLTHGELCERIADGSVTLKTPGVLTHLRLRTIERLSADQPNYAGLQAAKANWGVGAS